MSYKTRLIKLAIKWTPEALILWVGNFVLKGIATLNAFSFDLDHRKIHVQTTLFGESEPIEIWLEDFAIVNAGGAYQFILNRANSNRAWLTNIFAHITGRPWTLPAIPAIQPYMGLVAEVFEKAETAQPPQIPHDHRLNQGQ